MAKVTSKLQVTIPKSLADRFGIQPGDDIEWVAAGETIRIVPQRRLPAQYTIEDRVTIFDQATERQRERETQGEPPSGREDRGWTRDGLYRRGRTG